MARFSPTDIDALLETKTPAPAATDIPDGFFDDMQSRILAAATAPTAVQIDEEIEDGNGRIVQLPLWRRHAMWRVSAAAVVLLCLSAIAVKYTYDRSLLNESDSNIYAVAADATDSDIESLDDLYEADVFLELL